MKHLKRLVWFVPLILLWGTVLPAAAQMCDLTSAAAFQERAASSANAGDYESAIADYTCAIALAPDNPDLYNERGIAYYNLYEYTEALNDYEKALELDPNYPYAYNNRGNIFYSRGNYERAIEDYTRSIELGGDQPEIAYYNRGNAYQEIGQYEAAIADLTDSIALNDEYADSYLSRAWVYLVTNDERAHADFARWIELIRTDVISETLDEALARNPLRLREGTVYRLTFDGTAGDKFQAAAQADVVSLADPLLVLLDPDGVPVTSDDDSGVNLDAIIANFILPATGEYTLLLSHAGVTNEGNVSLIVSLAGTSSSTVEAAGEGDFSTYRLYVNEMAEVYTTSGDRLNLREGPGLNFEIVGKLDRGTLVTLLEGPRKQDGYAWWRIRTADGQEGWSVERVEEEQTLQLALLVGEDAIVTSGEEKLNVRATPARSGELLTQLDDGTRLALLDVPTIADNFRWWKVRLPDGSEGYVVDRVGEERMIIPAREVERGG